MHQGGKADGCDLSRNLGDSNRSAELIGGFAADDDAADIAQRPVDHEPCFLSAEPNGLSRGNWLVIDVARCHRAANAENADAADIAETVLDFLERRGCFEHELPALAVDLDRERAAGTVAHDALHIGEIVDRLTIDG